MKIFYILHGRFPTEKAHGVQIAKLCEALGRQGHEVTLVAPRIERLKDPYEFYSVDKVFKLMMLPIFPLNRSSRAGFMLEKICFLAKAARLARKIRPDMVITREPLLLGAYSISPVILEMHDLPRHLAWYKPLLLRAHRIIAKTDGMRDDLRKAGVVERAVVVLPNAIDPREYGHLSRDDARRELHFPSEWKIALYTGSLQAWKGVGTIMRAAPLVPEIIFMIVGGKPDEIRLLQSGASSNVHFVGAVSHAQVPHYLAAADMVLLPNERGNELSERYTSPLKLFEYQAAGKPLIASSLPALHELLSTETAYFFEPGDEKDLARVIREVLSDPRDADGRAERARLHVLVNTWEAYARKLVNIT